MLKTIPPTTNCGCGYFKSKCAEIHYKTSDFSILCIFCGMTTLSYNDFLEHFQSHHFGDFTNAMQGTPEPIMTAINVHNTLVKGNIHHDPLEFGDREIGEDPEEVMKKLQENQLDVKQLKTELQDEAASGAKSSLSTIECEEQSLAEEFNESDDEFLICKIKVEQCDLQDSNPTKSCKFVQSHQAKIKEESRDAERSIHYETLDKGRCRIDNENDDNSDVSKPASEEDIDWTKSYEPTLLKNHEKRPYKPRNKPNICTYCGRTFRRRYQLETHLNIHTGSKPHQCEVCGRLFRAVTTLTRHLNTHEIRDAYNCKFCDKEFTHKAALLSHQLRHTQERSVPCDECDKCFYTVNQMDTHKRKVHKVNEEMMDLPFACELCSKRYRSASMLSTHKFKKHYKTAKYFCEKCGKKFIDDQQLERHKLIHVDGLTNLNIP